MSEAGVDNSKKVAQELAKVLADTFTIYQKTHGYHWNVTGPTFRGLHLLFEEQYNEIWTSVDEIAERIRALNATAPMGASAMGNLTSIKDGDPNATAEEMLKDLAADHATVVATLKAAVKAAEDAGDVSSADLATTRLTAHEKHLWMINATLKG
jgi:starvation-inducible DNA-binding protein